MEAIVTSGVLTSLAGRYAKALFDLSMQQGQVDAVGKGLKALEKQIRTPQLAQVLADQTIQRDQQAAVLQDVCAGWLYQKYCNPLLSNSHEPDA